MKKYIWILCLLALICTSCSPKIIGATPHRRDRHCGCENQCTPRAVDDFMADANECSMVD